MEIGILFSDFKSLDQDQKKILENANNQFDFIIAGLHNDTCIENSFNNETDNTLSVRYKRLKESNLVDKIIFYTKEDDILEILKFIPGSVQIEGVTH